MKESINVEKKNTKEGYYLISKHEDSVDDIYILERRHIKICVKWCPNLK